MIPLRVCSRGKPASLDQEGALSGKWLGSSTRRRGTELSESVEALEGVTSPMFLHGPI